MTVFKQGDKVRISGLGAAGLAIGTLAEVTRVDSVGDVWLDDGSFYLRHNVELATPKYRTEKRKANVGERILITNATLSGDYYENGSINTVARVYDGDVLVKEHPRGIMSYEYEVIIAEQPSKSERISLLESQVAELTAQVEALEKPKTIGINLRDYVDTESLKLTPNDQRKAVIERAKAFVAGYSQEVIRDKTIPIVKEAGPVKVELHVNANKRVITAVVKWANIPGVRDTIFAKCDPSDVFNADIGKAIALGRALGLDVSEFENAVKPTEVVVGMVVRGTRGAYNGKSHKLTKIYGETNGKKSFRYASNPTDWIELYQIGDILDDTEAQY